ncbi:hypothetical protein ACFPH6_42945 [Streptomyces xiangluensis]|uniref:Uncharacterized protein n=1 Tax=Streptomyces xiangluensis TaxID=2665720 RepID=A0ABV8Z3Y0_9ACTN
MAHRHCPNCGGLKLHPFHRVNDAEQRYIASQGPNPSDWWRCGNSGEKGRCLWVQPIYHQSAGFSLPDSFR